MKRNFTLLMMLVFATIKLDVAAQSSSLLKEDNTQIPDSCQPIVPKDTTFFPINNDDNAWIEYEEMPYFHGGDKAVMDFVKANTIYPETAVRDSVSGRVVVRFAVGRGGCPTSIKILRGIREDLNNESIRVIKMLPKFIPGTFVRESPKGWYRTTVDVWYMVPFNYRLKKDTGAAIVEILPKKWPMD